MHDDLNFLPPHEPTPVAGFHAYSQCLSVLPGESVDIRVSALGRVRAEAMRIGVEPIMRTRTEPAGAVRVADLGSFQAEEQVVHRGSYVVVAEPAVTPPPLAIELWVRPLNVARVAGLISYGGYRLFLEEGGCPVFQSGPLATSVRLAGPSLSTKEWHHIVAQCDEDSASLFVDGEQVAAGDLSEPAPATKDPLLIGALPNEKREASALLTGDICGPSLYTRVLTTEEITQRYAERVTGPAAGCVGHWVFDAADGAPFRDTSPSGSHGWGVNIPLRMIPGPRREDEQVWHTYDPTSDPDFGHAVRLMADQLIDCRWPETSALGCASGIPNPGSMRSV